MQDPGSFRFPCNTRQRPALQVRQDGLHERLARVQPFADILARRELGVPERGVVVVRGPRDLLGMRSPGRRAGHSIREEKLKSSRWDILILSLFELER